MNMDVGAAEGEVTQVVYVLQRHAKSVKTAMEQDGLLDTRFRMTRGKCGGEECIAIPIKARPVNASAMIIHHGRQVCPYSTSKLGNNKLQLKNNQTLVQQGLLNYLITLHSQRASSCADEWQETCFNKILELDIRICPRKLEFIGDDRTLVIPRHAFDVNHKDFADLLQHTQDLHLLWESLAKVHNAPRVVRRGEIDPNSSVRASGHVILWPACDLPFDATMDPSDSTGWITITEQGISQSLDITKVMFSRGNISEKIRFGKLVQPDEVVLDMYAGIGYYSLPALVKGLAKHVYACEWNTNAAFALQYNLNANRVGDRATVFIGDSRKCCKDHNIVNMVDRVSLGLLPSSEGGWRTAIRALRHTTGGWLHVHGNVPVKERLKWTWWICQSLSGMVEGTHKNWIVYCLYVEKVKSFAPNVNHYVADVFCGPRLGINVDLGENNIGVCGSDGGLEERPDIIEPPSCALDHAGVLNQVWMMEEPYL